MRKIEVEQGATSRQRRGAKRGAKRQASRDARREGRRLATPTVVIFRIWPKRQGGDVIALFPEEPGTNDPWTCSCYQHVGQHGSASVELTRSTRLATPEEYAALARELERLSPVGYRLDIRKRITRGMTAKGRAALTRK